MDAIVKVHVMPSQQPEEEGAAVVIPLSTTNDADHKAATCKTNSNLTLQSPHQDTNDHSLSTMTSAAAPPPSAPQRGAIETKRSDDVADVVIDISPENADNSSKTPEPPESLLHCAYSGEPIKRIAIGYDGLPYDEHQLKKALRKTGCFAACQATPFIQSEADPNIKFHLDSAGKLVGASHDFDLQRILDDYDNSEDRKNWTIPEYLCDDQITAFPLQDPTFLNGRNFNPDTIANFVRTAKNNPDPTQRKVVDPYSRAPCTIKIKNRPYRNLLAQYASHEQPHSPETQMAVSFITGAEKSSHPAYNVIHREPMAVPTNPLTVSLHAKKDAAKQCCTLLCGKIAVTLQNAGYCLTDTFSNVCAISGFILGELLLTLTVLLHSPPCRDAELTTHERKTAQSRRKIFVVLASMLGGAFYALGLVNGSQLPGLYAIAIFTGSIIGCCLGSCIAAMCCCIDDD